MKPRFLLLLPTALLLLAPSIAAQDAGKKPPADDKKPAADKVDFVTQILPILEKNCVECHKAPYTDASGKQKRPKGGVILETKDGIAASKKGKLIVAKKPDDSKLIAAISLPADDEDRMPPAKKGDPLPKEQIELLRKWVEQGAEFGTWTGAADKDKGGKDKEPEHGKDHELQELAAGLAPLADDCRAQLAAIHARVEPIADDCPLVHVSFLGAEDQVDDTTIRQLLVAKDHIAGLALARTNISDAAGTMLGQMPHLLQLDLRETRIGDAGVAALASLPHLRRLNLFSTPVGDQGIAALAQCADLTDLYLWQTPASAAAIVALQNAKPRARIVCSAELPEPMADEQTRGRGRRQR